MVLLSVSVDLDEIHHYYRLHGLERREANRAVYVRAVPRLADWASQRGVPLTWFVVGQDLELSANAEAVRRLVARGDELGCHSYSHPYDLTRRSFSDMEREVTRGVAAIREHAGTTPHGFRAPGYVVNDALLALLRERELVYDSSVFPCPAYYALKAAAIAKLSAQGRRSRAIVDVPDMLRAPAVPYRVGRPYWFRGTGILELPIQVTRRARLPFIGTALTMAGAVGARLLARSVIGEQLVNLELHGIDALDAEDGLADLAKSQRDLRLPWSKKLDAIDAAVSLLKSAGYACVRMDQLADVARSQV